MTFQFLYCIDTYDLSQTEIGQKNLIRWNIYKTLFWLRK